MNIVLGEKLSGINHKSLIIKEGYRVLYQVWRSDDCGIEGPDITCHQDGSFFLTFNYGYFGANFFKINVRVKGEDFELAIEEGCKNKDISWNYNKLVSRQTLDGENFLKQFKDAVFRGQALLGDR